MPLQRLSVSETWTRRQLLILESTSSVQLISWHGWRLVSHGVLPCIVLRDIPAGYYGSVYMPLHVFLYFVNFILGWFVWVERLFVTVMDISRPYQPEKLIPLLPWPGFDPSFSGHNDRRAITASGHDYASDRSAIGAGTLFLEKSTLILEKSTLILEKSTFILEKSILILAKVNFI